MKGTVTLERAWRNQKPQTHGVAAADLAPSAPPPPVLLNEREAAAVMGIGARKFHALRSEPWMPAAIELGPRCLRWNREELIQALAARAPRRTVQAEPIHFQQARARRKGSPMVDTRVFQQLQQEVRLRRLAVHLSNRDFRLGHACIFIKQNGVTLAEFHQPEDALAWLTAEEGRA